MHVKQSVWKNIITTDKVDIVPVMQRENNVQEVKH